MFTLIFVPMRTKAGGKFYPPDCHSNKPAISSRDYIPYTVFRGLILHYGRPSAFTVLVMPEMFSPISDPMRTKAGGKFTHQILYNNEPAIPSRHSVPYTLFRRLILHYGGPGAYTVLVMPEILAPISDAMHAKAAGKFNPQICNNNKPAILSRHSIPYMFVPKYACVCQHIQVDVRM